MEIEKYTLFEFLFLDDDKKTELSLIYNHIVYDIDCKQWTWGDLKEAQYKLKKELTYQVMIEIVSMQIKTDLMQVDAHVFFGTFNGIRKSIIEITEIENNALGHIPTGNEVIASEEVGGFESFGYLPELDRLSNGNILNYDKIKQLSWGECFTKLAYEARQNRYNNKLIELNTKKND